MSGVGKSVKGAFNRAKPFLKDGFKPVGFGKWKPKDLTAEFKDRTKNAWAAVNPSDTLKDIETAMTPDNSAMEELMRQQQEQANQPPMPMPDEEELRRARRRAGGSSRGGRASTIMSGGGSGQGQGLGG